MTGNLPEPRLAGQSASGRLTTVITDTALVLTYPAFAAVCAAIA